MVNNVGSVILNTTNVASPSTLEALSELIQQGKEKEAVSAIAKLPPQAFEVTGQIEPLFFAAAEKRLKTVVEALIAHVDVRALSPQKQETPLMIVAELRLANCALQLLQRGACLSATDASNQSAFSYLLKYLERDFINESVCCETCIAQWDVQTKATHELMRFLWTQDRIEECKAVQERARTANPSWWQAGMEQSKKQLGKALLVLVYQYGSQGQLVDKQTGKQQAELLKQEILKCKEEHFVYGYSPTLIMAYITNKRPDALEKMQEFLAVSSLSPTHAAAFAFIALCHGQRRYVELFKKIAVADPKTQMGPLWIPIFFTALLTHSFSTIGPLFLNFSADQKRVIFTHIPAVTEEIFQSFNALWDKPCGDQFYVLIDKVCAANPTWWQQALEGRTDLFITMLGCGHKKTAHILAEKGAIDVTRYEAELRQTPLMLAAQYGDEQMMEALIRQKARLSDVDRRNKSALGYLQKNTSSEFVERMIGIKFQEEESLYEADTGVVIAELFESNHEKLAMNLLQRLMELKKEPALLKTGRTIGYTLFLHISKYVKKYPEHQETGALIAAALSHYVTLQFGERGFPIAIDVALQQNWQTALLVLVQKDFKNTWDSCTPNGRKEMSDAICTQWGEEFLWDIIGRIDVEEEIVAKLMKDFALIRPSIAVRLFDRLEQEQPEWWKKKGSKETWFNKLVHTKGASAELLEKFAQVIDVQYVDEEDDEFVSPVIAAAQAGLQKVVQILIDRGCDLTKEDESSGKSGFEHIERAFDHDIFFVQKVLEQCSDERFTWLKTYNNLLVLLKQKKNDEAVVAFRQAIQSPHPVWMKYPKRLSRVYTLACENGIKEIVAKVIGAMEVEDGKVVLNTLITNTWEDLVLELLRNENCSQQQQFEMMTFVLQHYASHEGRLEEWLQAIPVTNTMTGQLLKALLKGQRKDKALLLFQKCCAQQTALCWLDNAMRLQLFKIAQESDAKEFAQLVVKGNEASLFEEDSFLQIAVEAGWKEIVADLIVKGADILQGLIPCYEAAEKAFGEEFIILALEQCVVPSQPVTLGIIRTLVNKKKIKAVESFCKRFMTSAQDGPAWSKTAIFKTNCLIPLVAEKALDAVSLELVSQGADVSLEYDDNTTVMQGIEKQRDMTFITSLLQQMKLEQPSCTNLLNDLLKRGKKEAATVLFTRISDSVHGASWYKEKAGATILFDLAITHNAIEIAQKVVEYTSIEKLQTQQYSSLVYLAKMKRGTTEWKAIARRLVERGACVEPCGNECGCFSIVKNAFPQIAEMMIETRPIEQDCSAFLINLIDQNLCEEAYALYGRIFSASPSWLTKEVKTAFFCALAPYAQDGVALSFLESLIDEDAFAIDGRSKGKTPLMVACENSFPKALVEKILNKGDDTQLLKLDREKKSAFSYLIRNGKLATTLLQNQHVQTFLRRIGLNGYLSYQDVYSALVRKSNYKGKDFNRSIAAVMGAHQDLLESLQDQNFNFKYWTINQLLKPECLTSEYEALLIDASFIIDTAHYKADVMPKVEIAADSKTTLEDMKKLFMAYAEDTKDVRYIDTFITRIRDRIADVATPAGKGALEEFYKTIQNQVLVVIEYFNTEIAKIETNGVTLQNAAQEHVEGAKELLALLREWLRTAQEASQYCAARLQDHAREYYTRCIRKQKYDMKTFVLNDLAELRNLLVQSFSTGTQSVHVYSGFTSLYGEEFGLPGFEEGQKFQDKWISVHRSEIEHAKRQLVQRYTPSFLLEHMRYILKEHHLKFVDFLEHLDTPERKNLDSHLVQFIVGKIRGLWTQNTPLETNQKKVREYLESAPYYIYLDDKEYISKEKVMAALEKEENKARAIYALADKDSGYSWTGVALLLLALKVLK